MGCQDCLDCAENVHGRAGISRSGGWIGGARRCEKKIGEGESRLEVRDGMRRKK